MMTGDPYQRRARKVESKTSLPDRLENVPVEKWLTAKQLAAFWGLKEDSAERWISSGVVPKKYVRYVSRRYIRIHPYIVPILEASFAAAHH